MHAHSQLEIRQAAKLTDEQRQQLFGWGDDIYGIAHLNLVIPRRSGLSFLLYADGEGPLSHAGVLNHRAVVNGESALIGGLGAVVTVPQARRRGYAEVLVKHAVEFIRQEWQTDLGLLFCIDRMVDYYAKRGWQTVSCPVLIDQPEGRIPSPFHVMTYPFDDRFRVIDSIDLKSASW